MQDKNRKFVQQEDNKNLLALGGRTVERRNPRLHTHTTKIYKNFCRLFYFINKSIHNGIENFLKPNPKPFRKNT